MYLVKCANCEKEYDADYYASTSCQGCGKYFCFCLGSSCFSEYHHKNKLYGGHSAMSITDPTWVVNLVSTKKDNE